MEFLRFGTDGKKVLYNPEFVGKYSIDEQVFLFAHEVSHVRLNHIYRSEGKDKELWNIATDAVINANLKKDGLKMPEDGGVDIPGAEDYDAETMYEKLLEEKQKKEQEKQQNGQGNQENEENESNNNSNGQEQTQNEQNREAQSQNSNQTQNAENSEQGKNQNSQDNNEQNEDNQTNNNAQSQSSLGSHGLWDKAIEDRKKEQQKNQKAQKIENKNPLENEKDKQDANGQKQEQSRNSDSESQENSINDNQKKTEEDENVEEISEKDVFGQNRIERKKQLEELTKELAKKSSQKAGSQFSTETRSLSDIGIATPLIDWRKLLRQAIKYDEEYTRKNARMRNGYFRHKIEQIPMPETEIVLDVSGSVSEILLKNFLRECKNILENSKVKVGCFDTQFHGFTEIKRIEDIDKLNFPIGGGTDFNAAVGAFSRRVPNKIIFTDGEASMPRENVRNVIWVVFGDRKINPKGGKVINITGEQLERLYQSYNRYMVSERQ